VQPWGSC